MSSETKPGDLGRLFSRLLKEQREQADLAVCLADEELAMAVLGFLTKSPDGSSVAAIASSVGRWPEQVLRFLESAERLGNVRKRNAIRWEIAWPEGFKYRQENL